MISASDEIILWEIDTGQILRQFEGHNDLVFDLDISSNGKYLASTSLDQTAIIWDMQSGEIIKRLEFEESVPASIKLSEDMSTVYVGTSDGDVILWRNHTLKELQQWTIENRYIPVLTCEQRISFDLPEHRRCGPDGEQPPPLFSDDL